MYVNHEQREKPPNDGRLTQEAVDRAFRNKPRRTNLVYEFSRIKIAVINGKFTGRLGVEERTSPTGILVDVTCLERTLIDIAVRPHYAGSIPRIIGAFAAVREKVSIKKVVKMLRQLDYTYPYHQAIGFYLGRAGYAKEDQRLVQKGGLDLNFYLSHGLKDPQFDPEWRIWYPPTLGLQRNESGDPRSS